MIIKVEIFHEELPFYNGKVVFVDFFTVCNFMLSVRLSFVSHSILVLIGLPSNLQGMTGGPRVFREVDRSDKQIKFHPNRYLYQTEKRALALKIYQNRREEITVLRFFQYKWKSKQDKYFLKDTCPTGQLSFLEIFESWNES